MDEWVETKDGSDYMKENAHLLLVTAPGARWFERKGDQWIESGDGSDYRKKHALVFLLRTAPGARWFERKGLQWIEDTYGGLDISALLQTMT